jgi:hypothetical protein
MISILIIGFTTTHAQQSFYLKPSMGIVWNGYENSNSRITGNEKIGNIFWDNDWIFGMLVGYNLSSKFSIETGMIYHNAANRYHFDYNSLTSVGGSSVSLGDGFYEIPLNIKYSFKTGIENLKLIPYLGISGATRTIKAERYSTIHIVDYETTNAIEKPVPIDTTATINVFNPRKNSVLINGGLGLEYTPFDGIIITIYGNFTSGFNDMNELDVEVFLKDRTENGTIAFRGNKFYLSGGIKIPFRFGQ